MTRLELMRRWSEDLHVEQAAGADSAELRNIALVGLLIAPDAPRQRDESRGLHWLTDRPERRAPARETWARVTGDGIRTRSAPLPAGEPLDPTGVSSDK